MPKHWFKTQNKTDTKNAEIHIFDFIGEDWYGDGVNAKSFNRELKALGDVDTIDVFINSPGGAVFDGHAIHNMLMRHPATINVFIDGMAASIASVIAMAGDTITMPANALMMIHNPVTIALGDAQDMRDTAEFLEKVKTASMSAYEARTGLSADEISKMMDEETWMTAAEAVAMGFADETTEPIKAVASFDALKSFEHTPEFLTRKKIKNSSKGEDTMPFEMKDITRDFLVKNCASLVEEIKKEGVTEGTAAARAEGAKAEMERIKSVEEQFMPGHEALIASMKFDGKTTGPEAAVAVLNAEKQQRASIATNLQQDAPAPIAQQEGKDQPVDLSGLPVEERCKAEWEQDAKLREQYISLEVYTSFTRAKEEGRVASTTR